MKDRWRLTGAFRHNRLIGDAADSPLVEDEGSEGRVLFAGVFPYAY